MSQWTDQQWCEKAWSALERELGPVDALRFLSLIRSHSRDYRAWREKRFGDLTPEDLFAQMSEASKHGS